MRLTLNFHRKMILLVLIASAAIAGVSSLAVTLLARQIEHARRDQLVAVVQAAHSVVAAYRAQAVAGAMPDAQARAAAIQALRPARFANADGKPNYFFIWGLDGVMAMHPIKPEWEGQVMLDKVRDGHGGDVGRMLIDAMAASRDGTAFVDTFLPRPGQTEPVPKLQYVIQIPGWNWMVGAGLYMDDVDAEVRAVALRAAAAFLAILLVLGLTGWAIRRSVERQLGGDPAEAAAAVAEVARGNLTVVLPAAPAGSLIDALARMVESLHGMVSGLRQSTDSIGSAAGEIASGNADLSTRTELAAASLEQTASTVEQLTRAVCQSADSAHSANGVAAAAADVARRGGEAVSQVVQTMGSIHQASQRIVDIIGVIDGIAFQTNILALNAAVEAARAGEQGRGFAVVAGEVRILAQRSAEAAKEIKSLIAASVEKVEAGTRQVETAGRTMHEIVASVQQVAGLVGQIASSASEQRAGIEDVNGAVTQLDQMTQQNAALVEQAAAAAQSLRDQAARLADVVLAFQVDESPGGTGGTHRHGQEQARPRGRHHLPGAGSALVPA